MSNGCLSGQTKNNTKLTLMAMKYDISQLLCWQVQINDNNVDKSIRRKTR